MDQNSLNKIVQQITDNKNVFLVLVVVLVSVIAAVVLYGDYSSKVAAYKKENQVKLDKIALLGEFNKSRDALDMFSKKLPKVLNGDQLVNVVEEIARLRGINIISIVSRDPQRFDLYTTTSIRMTISVKSFKDLVVFLDKVETAKYSLKVEFLSIKSKSAEDGSFDCELSIIATQMNT